MFLQVLLRDVYKPTVDYGMKYGNIVGDEMNSEKNLIYVHM